MLIKENGPAKRTLLLMPILFAVLATTLAVATDVTFEIRKKDGSVASGAFIQLKDHEERANKEGRVLVKDLEGGIYRIKVRQEGREMIFSKVSIPESQKPVTIRLRLRW